MIETSMIETSDDLASDQLFINPFRLEDLRVFDVAGWRTLLNNELRHYDIAKLAVAMQAAPADAVTRLLAALPHGQRSVFAHCGQSEQVYLHAQQTLLDTLFWPLTYWCTPEWYDELTAGECIHPTLLRLVQPDLAGRVVADLGAGSGRMTFAALVQGATQVHAIDSCPALLQLLQQKTNARDLTAQVAIQRGDFEAIPLADHSMDVAISCATFIVDDAAKAEQDLGELRRIVRKNGKILLIWPRPQDVSWLRQQGFHHVAIAPQGNMAVHFRSLAEGLQLAWRFYGRKPQVLRYLLDHQTPAVPYAILGMPTSSNYCWMRTA